MSESFQNHCRVEWHDTDAAGIAHFTSFFRYMEETEHAFLRSLGFSVLMQSDAGRFSWPRVSVGCEFTSAVKFDDVVDVDLTIVRLGEKSVGYRFRMTHAGRSVAEGRLTAVYCVLSDDGPPRSSPIPAEMIERLLPYLTVS
jgi:YbgC/YbaW family acyl-CoA thioester hydrolase